jgi:hypothetical protein
MSARRIAASGNAARKGEPWDSKSVVKNAALSMNMPSAKASIRYSGQ